MGTNIAQQMSLLADRIQDDFKVRAAVVAVTLAFIAVTADVGQLLFALIGGLAYAVLQARQLPSAGLPPGRKAKAVLLNKACAAIGRCPASQQNDPEWCSSHVPPSRTRSPAQRDKAAGLPRAPLGAELRQPSARPVAAPTFSTNVWDAAVQELLQQITPTRAGDRLVDDLAAHVARVIRPLIPEVEVTGFASGDFMRGTAFGVAVPEVEIVACASPDLIATRLRQRHVGHLERLDPRKLQKSAIRACTDRLIAAGEFRFRRSAFRCEEPKVTLLAPAVGGSGFEGVPINFSVNSTTVFYNAALLTECGRLEPRAKALILLVRRWAKDRGICHAAKGHLPPYMWTLLVIFFLQVRDRAEGPLLPPFGDFALSGLMKQRAANTANAGGAPVGRRPLPQGASGARTSVGALLKEFIRFYAREFDFRGEAVSVRLGRRGPPGVRLPLHMVVLEDGITTHVGPSIEDPFEERRNLGDCTNERSLARLKEELLRADTLASSGASLSELLEPWAPPEASPAEDDVEGYWKG